MVFIGHVCLALTGIWMDLVGIVVLCMEGALLGDALRG